MKDLHWLPIKYRIDFKILLIVYKCLTGSGPVYLNSMFKYADFNHSIYLHEPRVLSHFGERSFEKCGPKLWNSLPLELKSCSSIDNFKSALKTYLFNQAFNII